VLRVTVVPTALQPLHDLLDGAHVGIWGFRAEGVAALRFLRDFHPAAITIVDDAGRGPRWAEAEQHGDLPIVGRHAGDGAAAELARCDVVIRSSGVSVYGAAAEHLRRNGTRLVGGMELFTLAVPPERIIGVTGTKGKSTTSTAIHRLLTTAGQPATLIGNVGVPVLDRLAEACARPELTCVVEVSSYQAADIATSPATVVLTSLFADHLDWHGSYERYVADKANLFSHPAPTVALHANAELIGHRALERDGVTVHPYGGRGDVTVVGDTIRLHDEAVVEARDLQLRGAHNRVNLCGAISAVRARLGDDATVAAARVALPALEPLADRLDVVARHGSLTFAVDALATIPAAAIEAVDAFSPDRVALIVGGQDRGVDQGPLVAALATRDHVAAVIGLPDTGHRIVAELAAIGGNRDARAAGDLDEAVRLAVEALAGSGTVLLSPAAPSFNRYLDYRALSEHFRAIVAGWADGGAGR
jgi:UDP-N-acetylmuramoylalanine--D-glutamate ligase